MGQIFPSCEEFKINNLLKKDIVIQQLQGVMEQISSACVVQCGRPDNQIAFDFKTSKLTFWSQRLNQQQSTVVSFSLILHLQILPKIIDFLL